MGKSTLYEKELLPSRAQATQSGCRRGAQTHRDVCQVCIAGGHSLVEVMEGVVWKKWAWALKNSGSGIG